MSEVPDAPAPSAPPKENPEALELRGRPRPAVRFRRGLIVAIAGAGAAALVGVSWAALEPPSFRKAAETIDVDAPERAPDTLDNAPRSYGEVPRLGPPLPGDLGRAILDRRRSLDADAGGGRSAADAERERIAAADAAARSSPVLVRLTQGAAGSPVATLTQAAESGSAAETDTDAVPSNERVKSGPARSPGGGDVDSHALRAAPSAWTLSAGTVIPASLITGLNSDLPGMVLAQVTENVRDSATGRTILVPQGARLIGSYDSAVVYGQQRAMVVWNRIVFPDASSIDIDNVPAADLSGYSGLRDGVDSHGWRLLKGVVLSTLLGIGGQLSFGGSRSDLVRAIRESAQQDAAHAGDRVTSRNLDARPTLTVRPGWPVNAILNRDLVLQPWRG